jgi:hypothetical protein
MSNKNNTPEDDALRHLDGESQMTNEEKGGLEDLENAAKKNYPQDVDSTPVRSLGRAERTDYGKDIHEETSREYGFYQLDSKQFPSRGKFYTADMKIRIKAATVKDIRGFSALDEENPYEVDEALVDLLSSCVKVSFSNRVGSWKDLLEEDRLYLILSIRELTFADGENNISFKVKCESCSTENSMEIKNENFQRRELNEKIAKYYSPEDLCFNVETKTQGVITIKPPTIGIMRVVNKYIKELQEKKVNVKEQLPFLKALPYMAKEWRGFTTKDIDNLRMDFMRWDKKQFLLFSQLTELAQVSVKEKMMKPCEKCMDPIEADIELPTGIKGLFIEQNILDNELL